MKEHQIPIQLSNYAHFIVGSSRDILQISLDSPQNECGQLSSSFINHFFDLDNQQEQFVASIKISDIQKIFPINNINPNLNLSIYVSLPKIQDFNLGQFISIESRFCIEEFDFKLAHRNQNFKRITFNLSNEFCPINLKEETDFYYGYFLNTLTLNEQKLFLESSAFKIKENKIGGFNPFSKISLHKKEPFDFSAPIIPLISINNSLSFYNKKFSLIFFTKENFLNNNSKSELLSFLCVF